MSLSTIDILARLVSFPSVSRDPNVPLINWVRNYLADHGIESRLIPDASGAKANLFASIGPYEEGGVVFSGHTDVVPTDGQDWSSNPFALISRGSRLHGRGACDMKGFIAAVLSHVPQWTAAKLTRPVHIMLSYDEEVGCQGAPSMIAAARQSLPRPAGVIVGEPTNMRIATRHKGIVTARTHVCGIEAHSSLTHQGMSAVMLAGELIAHLAALSRKVAGQASERMHEFDPPYTTFGVNRIEGGTAFNILAASCEFYWDIRVLPGETPGPILESLAAFANARLTELAKEGKRCAIETTVLSAAQPLKADEGDAESLTRAALGTTEESITVPFATEAGQFQSAGWSTVVCGPGSIEQAHKADEFVERAELAACETLLERVVARKCAG